MPKYVYFLLLLFVAYGHEGSAQRTIAIPQIINYSSKVYQGGVQNWDVTQDQQGIMYFANNEGLLAFDGLYWRIYPLPNATIVRSACFDGENRIYVGGQDEIGYFEANEVGSLVYHSLIDKIPESERLFADVWHIEILDGRVFFQTNSAIFTYRSDAIKVDKPHSSWQYMALIDGRLYAQDMERGLFVYGKGHWALQAATSSLPAGSIITGLAPYRADTLLVATMKSGLFLLVGDRFLPKQIETNAQVPSNRISSLCLLGNDLYALGMHPGGMLIMDQAGQILQRYRYGEGLQTNNLRDIFKDRKGNLWLALDDGIDYVAMNSAITYIYPDPNFKSSAYSMRIFRDKLYVGGANGLYATGNIGDVVGNISMVGTRFKKVTGSDGQVWSLQEVNDRLLVAHEDGSFVLDGDRVQSIVSGIGIWNYQAASRVAPAQHSIVGSYFGLRHLLFDGRHFIDDGPTTGMEESLRFVYYDDQTHAAWVSHPYRGVFGLSLSADFKTIVRKRAFGRKDGIPDQLHNYVFHIRGEILVARPEGIYVYDQQQDRFVRSEMYEVFRGVAIQYMQEDADGNVWFATNKRLGVLDFATPGESKPYTVFYFPELNGEVLGGFESVYVRDAENVFVSGQKGGILLNYKAYKEQDRRPRMLIREINAFDRDKTERLLYGGNGYRKDGETKLTHTFNSLQFHFSAPIYEQQGKMEFSYRLVGLETSWSDWSGRSDKEYTNLPTGKYLFKVKARSGLGNESEEQVFAFRIAPPWYAHPISFLLYLVLFMVFILWLLGLQRKKLRNKHEHELQLRQLEIEKKEKEVVTLRNEKLEAEINFKDTELANLTMNIIQRGEVLHKIKDSVSQTMKGLDDVETQQHFKQLMRLIRSAERTNDDWEKFNAHIHHANENFFLRLKAHHPDLTANELKLCALLRMNLLSKEIAQLLHVTVKAVEVGRYRLRKKLKIDSEVNLYDFLMQYVK